MSGEPHSDVSGFTVDTLKAHIEGILAGREKLALSRMTGLAAKIEALERMLGASMQSATEAVNKAEAATERRFENINEFRGQLSDQARLFMPRIESERLHAAAAANSQELTRRVDARDARGSGQQALWGFFIGASGLIAAMVSGAIAIGHH